MKLVALSLMPILATPTFAADKCTEAAKLYGAMMRASLICNFPERPALANAIAVAHDACPSRSQQALKQAMRPGVEDGFKTFDRARKRDGERKACADWDDFMRLLGKEK